MQTNNDSCLEGYHLSVNRDILNFLSSLFQNLLFLQTGRKSAGKNFISLSHLELIDLYNHSSFKSGKGKNFNPLV